MMHTMDRSGNLRESIRNKVKEQQGVTIVEVMVAFVLVLLAIAMITTAASLATKIQKNAQENQRRTTLLAERAYEKIKPTYDSAAQSWHIGIDPSELSNQSTVELNFSKFTLSVQTADWTVSTTDGAIHTTYHIYN